MRYPLSVLFVVGSLLLIYCSSLALEGNNLVPRRPHLQNLPNEHLTSSSSRQPIRKSECTRENISVRKEWRTLSRHERKSYVDAVLCLRSIKPALYEDEFPGTNSRFDDFQALHINQSSFIHGNAPFLAWHRWFTWAFEKALRRDCGYNSSQPYWDWTLDSHNVEASPLFDGSDSSMSGNGIPVPHNDIRKVTSFPGLPTVVAIIFAGTGGGCVVTGPFANITVPFGPLSPNLNPETLDNPHKLDYKPHCLRRDLSSRVIEPALTADNVRSLLSSPNVTDFNRLIDLGNTPGVVQALHGGGHQGVGGDMGDFWSSPGDPIFYLHHAQIDRLWTLWQQLDPQTRQYALSGTGTVGNYPPSPVFKLNDSINIGKLSHEGPRPIRDLMSTLRGPFCYEYA